PVAECTELHTPCAEKSCAGVCSCPIKCLRCIDSLLEYRNLVCSVFIPVGRPLALVLVGMVAVAIPPASAAQKTRSKKSSLHSVVTRSVAIATPSLPNKKPLYSAERSLARKTVVARTRATASAREIAETVVPRYKVDAAGDLVPDL